MLGLFILGVLIGVGFLIYLGYKLPRKYFKSRVAGIIEALLVFCIFFGDHIYYYLNYHYICETQIVNKVYDQEAYERFQKNKNNYPRIEGKDLDNLKKHLPIIDKKSYSVIFDKENN